MLSFSFSEKCTIYLFFLKSFFARRTKEQRKKDRRPFLFRNKKGGPTAEAAERQRGSPGAVPTAVLPNSTNENSANTIGASGPDQDGKSASSTSIRPARRLPLFFRRSRPRASCADGEKADFPGGIGSPCAIGRVGLSFFSVSHFVYFTFCIFRILYIFTCLSRGATGGFLCFFLSLSLLSSLLRRGPKKEGKGRKSRAPGPLGAPTTGGRGHARGKGALRERVPCVSHMRQVGRAWLVNERAFALVRKRRFV